MRLRESTITPSFYLIILSNVELQRRHKAGHFQRRLCSIGCRMGEEDGHMTIDKHDIGLLRRAAGEVYGVPEIEIS